MRTHVLTTPVSEKDIDGIEIGDIVYHNLQGRCTPTRS